MKRKSKGNYGGSGGKMKPTQGLASMMNQGTGPKPVSVPCGNLEELMNQGSTPHYKPVEGRDKLRKLMNQ